MIFRAYALVLATLVLFQSPVFAQTATPVAPTPAVADASLPLDPAYTKGKLPNGLTYYVRRNSEPQNGMSIRVHIKVGGMMEEDDQQGWAHLLEHMMFRGTKSYSDGEANRVWQRLGARPGSHSNAFTSMSSTRYVLDIAKTDEQSLNEALKILAEMMENAKLDPAALRNEQQIIAAERAMRNTESMDAIDNQRRAFFWPGHRGGERNIIGEAKTVDAATHDTLNGFYRKWYRPDLATVVIVGDADPAMMARAIDRAFEGWRATGQTPPALAQYEIKEDAQPVETIVERNLTDTLQLIWQRPTLADRNTEAARKQELLTDLALRAVDQRLSNAIQESDKSVRADTDFNHSSYLSDVLTLQLTILSGTSDADREKELLLATRTLKDAISNLSDAELNRQYQTQLQANARAVARAKMQPSRRLADDLIASLDPKETITSPEYDLALLKSAKTDFNAAAARAILTTIFEGTPRVLHITSKAFDGGNDKLAAIVTSALDAEALSSNTAKNATIDAFKLPRKIGKIKNELRLEDLGVDRMFLTNNVDIGLKQTNYEPGQIQLRVKLGRGLAARQVNDGGIYWSVRGLGQAGYGPWTRQALVELGAGKQILPRFLRSEDGLVLSVTTNQANLADAMKVMVAAITDMHYNETAVTRLKMAFTASYRTFLNKPSSMMDSMGTSFLFGGDKRFITIPSQAQINELNGDKFKDFWKDEMSYGPVRVSIVGDFDPTYARAISADIFGRLKLKTPPEQDPALLDVRARPSNAAKRNTLYHIGDKGNGMLTMVLPTISSEDDLAATRALQFVSAIVRNRLSEGFRAQQGGTYMPRATTSINRALPRYGVFTASAEMPVDKMPIFRKEVETILRDIADNGLDKDSFERARAPILNEVNQIRRSNNYWTQTIGDNLDNPKVVDAMRSYISGREAVTPADVQRVTKLYLVDNPNAYEIVVLPLPDKYLKVNKDQQDKDEKQPSPTDKEDSSKPGGKSPEKG